MLDAADHNALCIQMPAGTTSWFPLAQFLSEKRREFDVPLAESFMTDLNSSLVKQFLHLTLAEGEAVTIGLAVAHGSTAYRV